jgi:perosamine synthetase
VIPIAKPYIGAEEQAAVADVLASGILAMGPRVREFEEAFAAYVQSPAGGVACSSGTSGLCAAVAVLDLPAGSKILTTPFSFIATANSIRYAGYTPVFADIDTDTFMVSAETIREALDHDPTIRAIILVHLYGQPCEVHEIMEIARARGVVVIEDCAQAHGAEEFGVPVGGIGDLGVFSFYPTKNMMTGEGGMLTGSNADLLARCRLYIDHGAPARYQHTTEGYNYRMTSIHAAIGLCQLDRLPAWNEARRRNAHALSTALRNLPWVTVPYERPNCTHVFHQYVLKVKGRDALVAHLTAAGVGTAVHYPRTIPGQPFYQDQGYSCDPYPIACRMAQEVLSLPVHPAVTTADVQTIIDAVRSFTPAPVAVG